MMETYKTKVASGGRVVIPAKARKALGIAVGDEVVIRVGGEGEAVISSIRASILRAQQMVRKYKKGGRSAVDELIKERRKEAERE